jgi:hypothetical protein
MSRALPLLLAALISLPLSAAYAGRDLILPVIGRSAGSGGRLFDTSLWITNLSLRHEAAVRLEFYESGRSNPRPRVQSLRIAAGETYVTDSVNPSLIGTAVMGAIRVTSSEEVIASARTYSRLESETDARAVAAAFSAIPAQFAIGNDETTSMQGLTTRDARYKLYLVEVTGHPLNLSVALTDARGKTAADKPLYIGPHMQMAADLTDLIPPGLDHGVLRIRGTNGEGRIVVAGAQIATESQDASAYEMTFLTQPRNRMPVGEVVAYVAVALAILMAVFRKGEGRRAKDV